MFRGGRRGGARFVPRHDRQANSSGEIQPPPLYPPLGDLGPRDLLKRTDDWNYTYLLALKRSYRATMTDSVYHLKLPVKKNDIERYSDKYNEKSLAQKFQPDWRRLPTELCITKKKKKKSTARLLRTAIEVVKKLDELEKREAEEKDDDNPSKTPNEEEDAHKSGNSSENEDDKEGGDSDEEGQVMESDNDYNVNYYESEKSDADESDGEHYY